MANNKRSSWRFCSYAAAIVLVAMMLKMLYNYLNKRMSFADQTHETDSEITVTFLRCSSNRMEVDFGGLSAPTHNEWEMLNKAVTRASQTNRINKK